MGKYYWISINIFYLYFFQDQALESSHQAREKEWSQFLNDFQNKCEKIDDAYNQKEKDLRLHFQKLEKDLN